ncbi:histone-lysine N-methyltransferase eggless isoform X1 [Procambarus clarkii]|uniref:histone-lysine N-methyltransferase eggless isoform X1 n=2 Tax=Procambarus clarkii TaxID=6728 RepID=UPI001E6716B3|nr:histone-lysine N-methyltransferase eggless-like isoform X2 [Procambarus clarkii]
MSNERKYVCAHCNYSYSSSTHLQEHLYNFCQKCKKCFVSLQRLENHHCAKENFCVKCNRTFSSSIRFNYHKCTYCPKCSYNYSTYQKFRKHRCTEKKGPRGEIEKSSIETENSVKESTGISIGLVPTQSVKQQTEQVKIIPVIVSKEANNLNGHEHSSSSILLKTSSLKHNTENDNTHYNLSNTSTMAEIIDLSDDDIVIEEVHRKKGPGGVKRPFRCLNSDCRAEKDLIRAEDFVRRYFGVLSYPKKKRVCITCLREAKSQQDYLVDTLRSRRLLLAEKLPPPKTTVVLTDSDSDPSDKNSSSAETDIEYEFDDGKTLEEAMSDLIVDLGLDRQITEGVKHLEERLLAVQEGFENLHTEEYSKIEGELDKVRKDFYNNFRPEIMWQPALDIGPSSTIVQQDGSGEVIAEPSVFVPNENLPPVGPLNRWELQPNELVYSMKYSLFARWVQAQVIEVERREAKNTTYKIRYNRNAKGSGLPRIMPGRQLAYINPCATRIPVGTRVIAKYRDDDPKNTTISGSFYVGVVAEIPTAANKYRYLIFFDDGYAQYVLHHDIRVVTESSVCPWEDVSSDSREFIKEYLQMYPERPMVRLQKWNYVKTEWNGRWWKAQVKEVDGSLVKMFFPLDGRSEWIYRGSTRLSPLFNKKLNIQAQAEQPLRTIRRRTAALPGRAVVEYGTFGQEQDIESSMTGKYPEASAIEAPGERRAVARKSTSSRPGTPPREVQLRVEQESKGFTNKHSFLEKIIRITPHTCSSKCLGASGDSMDKHKGLSPLLYPLLFGWHRTIIKQRRKTQSKNEICYVGPCGRRLRSIEEVFRYLRETESNLEIDCFSYETNIDVSHEWEPFKKILNVEDMSRGEENVPISCVNSLDEAVPQSLIYCNVRLPTEHVPLNLDPEFLVCCDCKDDCQDKSKCSCWQLTIEGTRILERNENSTAGYHYRRLFEQVQSGIYECNSRCKCSNHCLNRVVQHPLRLKLQLFKTARRGWGVRTLHDIPKGGFLCVYVGRMLNETIANEEGKIMGGDDYYAELDYIEVMENAKEGYEEEASTPDEEIGNNFAGEDRHIGGSESNESDGFYSENEVDNPKEDHDFNHPSHIKKAGFTKREKSARLQERAKHTKILVTDGGKEEGSGSGSTPVSDDETSKGTKKKNSERNCKKKEGAKDKETKAAKLLDAKKVDDKKADDKKADDKKADDKKADDKKDNSENMDEEEEQSDEGEDEADEQQRQPQTFAPTQLLASVNQIKPNQSVRDYFGKDEAVYIMDAKQTGNIGRFLNHSCEPNVFVQNAFVDTHDLRFPWVAFFAMVNIRAGTELTWDYNYEVDSVPGKIKYCYCGARKCRGRLL